MENPKDGTAQKEEEPTTGQQATGSDTSNGAEGQSNEPEGKGTGQDGDVVDKHGQPGINREKYQRDIAERDSRIAELEAQVAEAAKTEEGRKEMQEKIEELRQTISDDRVNFDLEKAGCLNTKAARAILPDYDGDIEKLKADCPYLFSDGKRTTGSTGIKPEGSPNEGALDEKLDNIFGV